MPKVSRTPEINNEFTPKAETVEDFLAHNAKRGFYIPLYQRSYSWSVDNIDQLMEDLFSGVENMLESDQAVSFLGTVILCVEQNRNQNIHPCDIRALPNQILNVIDGQQRISTLALLATRLHGRGFKLLQELSDDVFGDLKPFLEEKLTMLTSVFTWQANNRAEPILKPVIIRGDKDEWTLGGEDTKYESEVSNYLATYIRALDEGGSEIPDKRKMMGKNLKRFDEFISKIFTAHLDVDSSSNYPNAITILENVDESLIWQFERPDLLDLAVNADPEAKDTQLIFQAIQYLLFVHYFFNRTCFSVIEPSSDAWAFDIFQSLNATGTPLTALETFRPLVVNWANNDGGFINSRSETYYKNIEELFDGVQTAAAKTKLTNEFLNVFRLIYEGRSMQSQFSEQRKWLNNEFQKKLSTANDKEEFVHRMANLASYWRKVIEFDHSTNVSFHGLDDQISEEDRKLAVICVKYLNDANHNMANTILSRFYSRVIRNTAGANVEFAKACRVVAAFFTLWRSARSNSGLDDIYRSCLNGSDDRPNFSWTGSANDLTVEKLQNHFIQALRTHNIDTKENWFESAKNNLAYSNARTVCRFALFVTSHDCVVDTENPGMMKLGAPGVSDYMNITYWESSDLNTVEHVAPQVKEQDSDWDEGLYDLTTALYDSIGNLTLLPVSINSSVNNSSWEVKDLYYRHLAESDSQMRTALRAKASDKNIELQEDTLEKLCNATYASHIAPIVAVGDAEMPWDAEIVSQRTERIADILGDKMFDWLTS